MTNAVITIAIRLRHDYDPTTIRDYDVLRAPTRSKNEHVNLSSSHRSRIAVESNPYRNFDHFRRSRDASWYRRIVVESQL